MAKRLNPNSRIPMIPKPTLVKGATSTLNTNSETASLVQNTKSTLNFNVGNAAFKHIKSTISKTNLRRSKSFSDFRSMNTKIKQTATSSFATSKKPIKRPALTAVNPVQNKILKVSKPEPAKTNSKPVQPKFAPYDYKGRFNHLKEVHEKLKEAHRELKEQHESVADQNEVLSCKCSQLQNDLDKVEKLHEKVSSELTDLKQQQAVATEQIEVLQSKSDKLESELKNKTDLLEFTTKEYETYKNLYATSNERTEILQQKSDKLELELKNKTSIYESTTKELKTALCNLQDEKRHMHNTIQELKGNIRVFCRIRPPLQNEGDQLLYDVNYLDENSIEIFRTKDKKMEFSFDHVFGPNSSQSDIFQELSQLVQSALDGYNVCIFAYGQTGSGKTYTMEGHDAESVGMIPRSIDTIFKTIGNMKRLGWSYQIQASFLEIYNENLVDLLEPQKTNLEIRMCDAKGTDVYVSNLKIENIESAGKLKNLMKVAQRNRAVAATENNERSSRSHSVTKISLVGINEEQGKKCIGNLNLIDLAGSEKFYSNETTRLRETTNINKSLSNLSNVILCLVRKNSHIPYRNSKLTHLLMPSLGGNSKTLMLVNISPLDQCYNESLNSLRFASTVNMCKTGSIKKQKTQT